MVVTLISRFKPLIDSLDSELRGVRDQLLEPENILFLLLLADILTKINKFSKFLQKKNVVFGEVNTRLNRLIEKLKAIQESNGSYFAQHSEDLLKLSVERMHLTGRNRGNRLLDNKESIANFISKFKDTTKKTFYERT